MSGWAGGQVGVMINPRGCRGRGDWGRREDALNMSGEGKRGMEVWDETWSRNVVQRDRGVWKA